MDLAVIDAGHGIEADKLPRLFEPVLHDQAPRHGHGAFDCPARLLAHRAHLGGEQSDGRAVFARAARSAEESGHERP